jgi:uncharacterized protein
METIIELSNRRLKNTSMGFIRCIMNKIDWNDRLISIVGARGSGKTTLMLQFIKKNYGIGTEAIYLSLDNIYFADNRLFNVADRFVKLGGKALFLDEVHKYPNWSIELKNIYDEFPELKVVFSGSSMLELFKSNGDLSRRVSTYHLPTLSFREFIEFEHKVSFDSFSLDDILKHHTDIAVSIISKIKPIALFEQYLKYGAYPFFKDSMVKYHERLLNTINLILDYDLPSITPIDYAHVLKIKLLLRVISVTVPYKPNITKLATQTEINRKSVLKYLDLLERSGLIGVLKNNKNGDSILTKPSKIYLGNPNLMFALCDEKPNYGTLRETFFFNQLSNNYVITESETADFFVNNKYTFEIGGKSKDTNQLNGVSLGYIAADNLEIGYAHKIPLWLFGFLY